jgi:hypothetical protein
VFAKSVRVHVKAIRVLAGALKYQCRPCECSRGHKSASRGRMGANKGCESALEIVGEPKETARVYNILTVSTLSWP